MSGVYGVALIDSLRPCVSVSFRLIIFHLCVAHRFSPYLFSLQVEMSPHDTYRESLEAQSSELAVFPISKPTLLPIHAVSLVRNCEVVWQKIKPLRSREFTAILEGFCRGFELKRSESIREKRWDKQISKRLGRLERFTADSAPL